MLEEAINDKVLRATQAVPKDHARTSVVVVRFDTVGMIIATFLTTSSTGGDDCGLNGWSVIGQDGGHTIGRSCKDHQVTATEGLVAVATSILEEFGRIERSVVPQETTLVGRIRVRPIVNLCSSALRFSIQRVRSECSVGGLATFVIVATVYDIGVDS